VTLTTALSLSLNTVAVRLGLEVGPKTVVAVAHRLGISSDLDPVPSIALGSSEVTPLEMVSAYAAFANGGIGVRPHVIARVRTAGGKQLYARRNASFGRVIDPQYVAMMNAMMQETLLTGTARKAELPGWQAAGKTGTSQDWRDAWFVGYTSYLVAGVWLGNDDGKPTKKSSGGNLPVEIWSRFMKAAHQGVPVAGLPGGDWHNPEIAVSEATASPPQVSPFVGAPLTINRGGEAVLNAPPAGRGVSAGSNAPVPPASIPNVGAGASVVPPARGKSLLDKLFGAI
jgi:penicillin-binding protein 1A